MCVCIRRGQDALYFHTSNAKTIRMNYVMSISKTASLTFFHEFPHVITPPTRGQFHFLASVPSARHSEHKIKEKRATKKYRSSKFRHWNFEFVFIFCFCLVSKQLEFKQINKLEFHELKSGQLALFKK